jgi:hypothetical protein
VVVGHCGNEECAFGAWEGRGRLFCSHLGCHQVHSVSYGDDENSLDDSYMTRVDQEFQKLGLLGHTFVYASGDSGVDCTDSNTQVHCGGAHVVLSAVPFLTCLF